MSFILIEFSSKRSQILTLLHVHEINSIFGVLLRPFLFISVIDNFPNTIIHEICIFFVESFYILWCSWVIRTIYYFLINLFKFLLSVVERTELSCKLFSQLFILLPVIMPSSTNIYFKRVGSLNQKMHLINLVKLMREKLRVRYLNRNYQIISVVEICWIPVVSHNLWFYRCNSGILFHYLFPQFRVLLIKRREFILELLHW